MTKDQLRAYTQIKREKEQIERLIEELETLMTSPKIQRLDGMPHAPSKGENPMDALVIRHMDLLALYKAKLKELTEAQLQVEQAIESLDPLERSLMRLRYIDGRKWEEVAVAINYSWQQTHRLHAKALEKLRAVEE